MKQLLIISLLILSSCTPQKRLARLVKKHPQLVRIDTAVVHDTINIVTERTFRDSVFTIQQARQDTIVLRENNMTIKSFIYRDSVYLSGECDTIVKTKIVTVEVPYNVIENTPKTRNSDWFRIGLNILIVLLLLWLIINVRRNKKAVH